MKIRSLRYYARESVRNVIRNRLMSVASMLTVASCILIVSLFYCLAANVNQFLSGLEGTIQIAVFLQDGLTPDEVQELSKKISAISHVASAQYVSADEALEGFKKDMGEEIAAGLEKDNPFARSFNVTIDDLRFQTAVLEELNALKSSGVDVIRDMQGTANIVLSISNAVRAVLMVLIIILATISIVIITNTIRITVNARRGEITIMKYVGATDWFIRWPFVIEGILIGIIGGVLPLLICGFGYGYAITRIQEAMPLFASLEFLPAYDIFSYLIPFDIVLGILIGTVGSLLSIRKHLRV